MTRKPPTGAVIIDLTRPEKEEHTEFSVNEESTVDKREIVKNTARPVKRNHATENAINIFKTIHSNELSGHDSKRIRTSGKFTAADPHSSNSAMVPRTPIQTAPATRIPAAYEAEADFPKSAAAPSHFSGRDVGESDQTGRQGHKRYGSRQNKPSAAKVQPVLVDLNPLRPPQTCRRATGRTPSINRAIERISAFAHHAITRLEESTSHKEYVQQQKDLLARQRSLGA